MLKKSIVALLAVFLFVGTGYAASIAGMEGTLSKKGKDGIGKMPAHVELTLAEPSKGVMRMMHNADDVKITITNRKGIPIPLLKFANVKVQGGSLSFTQGNKIGVNLDRHGDTRVTADVVRTGPFRGKFYCTYQFGDETYEAESIWTGENTTACYYDPIPAKSVAFYPGSKKMAVDGKTVEISEPAVCKNGVAYVPLRAAVEAFGGEVAKEGGRGCVVSFADLRKVSVNPLDRMWYGYDNDGKRIDIPYNERLTVGIPRALRPGELPYIPEDDIMRAHMVKLSAPVYVSQKGNMMVPAHGLAEAMGIKMETSKGFSLFREKIVLSNNKAV